MGDFWKQKHDEGSNVLQPATGPTHLSGSQEEKPGHVPHVQAAGQVRIHGMGRWLEVQPL